MGMVTDFQIVKPEPGSQCDCCGATSELAAFLVTAADADKETEQEMPLGVLCAECLARGIQVATGFRAVSQLGAWRRMRGAKSLTAAQPGDQPSQPDRPTVVEVRPGSYIVQH